MKILKDYSLLSGLSAQPSKTKIGKINGTITQDEKAQLLEIGLNNSAYVTSFTFLGHKPDTKKTSHSGPYLKQLESKLTK